MGTWKDTLHEEIAKGGKESPCPLCGHPRVRRSDYIRCVRCAVNWMEGEPPDTDPREFRRRQNLVALPRPALVVKEKSHDTDRKR
jgi:uncharacterized C2H2 Zn-finger protein